MHDSDLALEQRELGVVEALIGGHVWELHGKVGAGDGRDIRGYVGEGAVEGGDGCIPEVVTRLDALDLVKWRVAGADDGDSTRGYGGAVEGGQVAGVSEWLEGLNNIWEGGGTIRLDIHEQVESLARTGVVDAIMGGAGGKEAAIGVLCGEDGQDRLDIQAVEGALVGEGGLFMAYMEGAVV